MSKEVKVYNLKKNYIDRDEDYVLKSDYDNLQAKLKIAIDLATKLEKQLEVCKGQRNWLASHVPSISSAFNGDISKLDQELEKVEG
jgi:leucyl-tRNA synthetase